MIMEMMKKNRKMKKNEILIQDNKLKFINLFKNR